MTDLEALKTQLETARAARAANNTPENREWVAKAWNALNEATPKRPTHNVGSRAGRRQYAERRAMVEAARRRRT